MGGRRVGTLPGLPGQPASQGQSFLKTPTRDLEKCATTKCNSNLLCFLVQPIRPAEGHGLSFSLCEDKVLVSHTFRKPPSHIYISYINQQFQSHVISQSRY